MMTLYRAADVDLSSDGRNVEGLAFRWNHPSLVSDDGKTRYREQFARGSAARTLSQRSHHPMFIRHEHLAGSVGETTFAPANEGLMFRARLYDGELPSAALERVSDPKHPEHLGAVSIGFRPIVTRSKRDAHGEIVERAEIAIEELSLATLGQAQHEGALVLAVRSIGGADSAPPMTPRLDALRRRRALLVIPR